MLDFGFYNRDCMEAMCEMPDKCIDLAICDPPYGGVTQGGYMQNTSSVLAKNKEYHVALWHQNKPNADYFNEIRRVSKNQIIWGGNYFADMLPSSQCWIVWDKENGENHFADCELAWASFNSAVRIFRFKWQGMLQGDMKHKQQRIHPSEKPIALYEWLLNKYAKPGDIILDTHVGSASSLIACHRAGHKFVGFEIDKEYYNQAKKRLDAEMAQINLFDFMNPPVDDEIQGQMDIKDFLKDGD